MTNDDFTSLQRFCLVLSCARTGTTLLAALLDAHPRMVFANEMRVPSLVLNGTGRRDLFSQLLEQARQHVLAGKEWTGFRYAVAGQHQGRCDRLEVLGDKSGVVPALLLHVHHELLDCIRATVGVRLQVIHNVRNPYDVIATMARRSGASLRNRAGVFFSFCAAIEALRDGLPAEDFVTVRHEELVAAPAEQLTTLCRFLGQDADDDYLRACAEVVQERPHRSRHEQAWDDELIEQVAARIRQFDFLDGYQFRAEAMQGGCR